MKCFLLSQYDEIIGLYTQEALSSKLDSIINEANIEAELNACIKQENDYYEQQDNVTRKSLIVLADALLEEEESYKSCGDYHKSKEIRKKRKNMLKQADKLLFKHKKKLNGIYSYYGSCEEDRVNKYLRREGYSVLDLELVDDF